MSNWIIKFISILDKYFHVHEWSFYTEKIETTLKFKNKQLQAIYGSLPYKHRKCIKCGKIQYYTQMPIFSGAISYDPNHWKDK